jgi:hypothetical protein
MHAWASCLHACMCIMPGYANMHGASCLAMRRWVEYHDCMHACGIIMSACRHEASCLHACMWHHVWLCEDGWGIMSAYMHKASCLGCASCLLDQRRCVTSLCSQPRSGCTGHLLPAYTDPHGGRGHHHSAAIPYMPLTFPKSPLPAAAAASCRRTR